MIQAPFPWFGGKSRAASLVWERLGNVRNYVEPFAGSLAVLLARPTEPGVETVNDLDCYLANFWRAVKADPEAVARWADWPVNEADLHARHRWLWTRDEFRARMKADPEHFDAQIAGWWAWGLCCWIGTGWCVVRGDGPPSQLPRLGDAGRGDGIRAWFGALAARLERVRVACGDWQRVLGPSVTEKHGITGVLLDPPYSSDEHAVEYGPRGADDVAGAVAEWARVNGDNTLLRIALCGYEGEHDMPASWECVAWKSRGGYGSQGTGRGRANARRERIWFSPACLRPGLPLFAFDGATSEATA